MINRRDLKERAKENFKASYWWYVLVSFIMGFFGITLTNNGFMSSGTSSTSGNISEIQETFDEAGFSGGDMSAEVWAMILAVAGVALLAVALIWLFAIVIRIFVLNHVMVGANRYLRERRDGEPDFFKTFFCTFKKGCYWNVTKAVFLKDLFVFLWSLLFIIPGIIASLRYRMVAPILSENPEMPASEALKLSAEMMDGNKWDTFVLDLSFLGWRLLTIFPPVGWFWSNPYQRLTNIELYDELAMPYRRNARLYMVEE